MTTTARRSMATKLAEDLKYSRIHYLFDELNRLADEGMKETAEWLEMWNEYKRLFKEKRGFTPHWVR